MAMGMRTKKFKKWKISFANELELDEMLNELYVKNYYDWKTTKKNPVIFDVGALIGETVLYFKDQYPQAQITAFEPSPRSFNLLKINVSQNKLTQVQLVNVAVAGKTGKMNFYTSKSENNPWGRGDSLKENQFNDKQKSKVVKVSAVKLSTYIKSNIDLLKLDIEGSETEVIYEIEHKLKFVREIILEFHFNIFNPENNFGKITAVLNKHGFKIRVFFSRWQLPVFFVNIFLLFLPMFGVKESWLRIYAKK